MPLTYVVCLSVCLCVCCVYVWTCVGHCVCQRIRVPPHRSQMNSVFPHTLRTYGVRTLSANNGSQVFSQIWKTHKDNITATQPMVTIVSKSTSAMAMVKWKLSEINNEHCLCCICCWHLCCLRRTVDRRKNQKCFIPKKLYSNVHLSMWYTHRVSVSGRWTSTGAQSNSFIILILR